MCRAIAATKEEIAFIGAISRDSDTLIPLAFCVLVAANEGRAFIGAGARDIDALYAITGKMRTGVAATEHGIAVILAVTGNGNTLIPLAFRVLIAANEDRAFV
ncbi:MAG: hypothetical protein Greene041662_206 [Candidatus Peregrinibacteria bacterium Greene0416_62]|nr:MAG: hypothetical protein Greene041662_206 [Candidatus Peregrinibacteria bacterium Greene0416_62]